MSVCTRTRVRTSSIPSALRSLNSSCSVSALDAAAAPPSAYPASPSRMSKAAHFAALGVRSGPSAEAPPRSTSTASFLAPRATSLSTALLSPLRALSISLRGPPPAQPPPTPCTAFTAPAAPTSLSASTSLASLALPPRRISPPRPESPTARSRRRAPPPAMAVRTTPAAHVLAVRLPHARARALVPEMVTVVARHGARLRVVVDFWALEHDAHFEWEVAFAHADVDLSAVRAVLASDGHLAIHVRRCAGVRARQDVVPLVWCP